MQIVELIGISRLRMGIDGHGITTLVAFHGCPLRCKYCLNSIVDWYNLEQLNEEQYNGFLNRFNNDKKRRTINRWLQNIESEQRSNYDSTSLLEDGNSTGNDVRLDEETLSRDSDRGGNPENSRDNKGESGLTENYTTPQGENLFLFSIIILFFVCHTMYCISKD